MVIARSASALTKTTNDTITASNVYAGDLTANGIVDAKTIKVSQDVTFATDQVRIDEHLSSENPVTVTNEARLGGKLPEEYVRKVNLAYGLEEKGEQVAEEHVVHLRHEPLGFNKAPQNRVGRLAPLRTIRVPGVDAGGHITERLTEVSLNREFARFEDLETRQPGRTAEPSADNRDLIVDWLASVAETERRKWWKRLDLNQPYELVELPGVVSGERFSSIVRLLDGRYVVVPENAERMGVVSVRGDVSLVGVPSSIVNSGQGEDRFQGGATLPDGQVALTPFELDTPVVWDPYTGSFDRYTESAGSRGAMDGVLNEPPEGKGSRLPMVCLSIQLQFGTYLGPIVRVKRVSDGVLADLFVNDISFMYRVQEVGKAPQSIRSLSDWAGDSPVHLVTWYDQSGNERHAQAIGTIPFVQRSGGPRGYDIDFGSEGEPNGDNYLRIPYEDAFEQPNRITIACAHLPTTWGPESSTQLVGRGNRHMLRRRLGQDAVTLTLRRERTTSDPPDESSYVNLLDPDPPVLTQTVGGTTWMLHVGTHDTQESEPNARLYSVANNDIRLRTAEAANTTEMSIVPSDWTIGRHEGQPGESIRPYHGRMFDVQIYDRAITETEVVGIWNSFQSREDNRL